MLAFDGDCKEENNLIKNKVECLTDSISPEEVNAFEHTAMAYTTEEDGTTVPVDCTVTIADVIRGTFSSGLVEWGSSHNVMNPNSRSVGSTFDFTTSFVGATLHAHYKVWMKGISSAVLTVCVAPSIFD